MKNLLLVVVVTFLLLSCEISKVVNYPNVDIKFENNTIFYKSKKYTGKMKIVIKDKGIQASLNVKEGKLNGKGNLKKDFEGVRKAILHQNFSFKRKTLFWIAFYISPYIAHFFYTFCR